MHELMVTQNVLDIALKQVSGGQKITALYLVVGKLSSMIDESVQFYWDIISEGTAAQGAQLHFRRIPANMQCVDCHQEYQLGGDDFTCPYCRSSSVRLISGDEFYLQAIDVEENSEKQNTP